MVDEMNDFLPYLLFQAAEVVSRDFQEYYQDNYGMLRTEWRVLFHLGQAGDQTAKQICERASLHKTKVSRAVKALEDKRFLSRETIQHDRRTELLSLTKNGRSALATLTVMASEYNKTSEQSLGTTEFAALTDILKKLVAAHQSNAGNNK